MFTSICRTANSRSTSVLTGATVCALERLDLSQEEKDKVLYGAAEALLGDKVYPAADRSAN